MKLSAEKIIFGITGIILGYLFLNTIRGTFALFYNGLGFIYMLGMVWYLGMYWTGNPERSMKNSSCLKVMAGIIVGGWLVLTLCYALYVGHLSEYSIAWWYIFHPGYIDNFLEWLIPGIVVGFIYGSVRKLILTGKTAILKKVAAGIGISLLIGSLIYMGIYFWDVNYAGNETIQFLDKGQQLVSLQEVLSQPELQGKKIYVDLWYSTCSPCIKAFKNLAPGRELLKKYGITTLYLGREISLPDSKQRWINTIRDFKLGGYHVYMSKQLEEDIFNQLVKYEDRYLAYPHYLIVDEKGNVTDWDAPGITELTALEESLIQPETYNMTAEEK